jgi:RND family efflux transporter MFP subunit
MKPALFVTVLLLAAAALWWYGAAAAVDVAAEFSVQVAARTGIADVVNATGVIKPRNGAEVRVGSRISGVLEKLHVDVGDEVFAGQLLAELDTRELQSNLLLMQARVAELEAQLAYSELLLERNKSITIAAEVEIAGLEKEVALNKARLQQVQASLANEKIRLAWTRVSAPIAGTIASVSTQQGETVAASFAAPTFLTIIDLTRLEIQAYVDESDIGKIVPQQQARFTVDTYPDAAFAGEVRTIYPKAEIINNVVNYIVILDIHPQVDTQLLLRPEMTTHLQFVINEVNEAITIPRTALFTEEGSDAYYVMLANGDTWEKRAVEVGIINTNTVEIIGGLSEGSVYSVDHQRWLAASQNEGK